jgi:uncharacterized protein GlcG (DUF336 family)
MKTARTIMAAALLATVPLAALAQDSDDSALVSFQVMKPEFALKLAQATLTYCRDAGYQIAVTVVDRSGLTQVVLRDRYAGPHTIETSRRKAWTAASFRTDTLSFGEVTKSGEPLSGIRHVSDAIAVGGGIPVEAAGALVGAVGVSGAPGGDIDHECAQAGIDEVAIELEF